MPVVASTSACRATPYSTKSKATPRITPVGMSAPDGERKVGYAVIGLGRIADHFLRGVQQSSSSKITGLVSGHRDKAERIAAQYGVPKSSIYSYEDMDRFRENKAIDAVYVALPNSMHAEFTIRSAKAGKHVLCEKPMSISVSEAEAMIAACKAANKTCEIVIYPDTPHAFNADYRPSYRAEQAKEGWAKMLAWFK